MTMNDEGAPASHSDPLRRPSRAPGEKLVLGLTGGIGAGKSTVAAILDELGATIVDCDGLGRLVVEPDGRAFQPLVDHFGDGVLQEDGQLDRAKLGSIVFNDPDELAQLNAITHPAIDLEIAERIATASGEPVVLDMAVLVESQLGRGQYHQVLVVEAPLDIRLARLRENRQMTDEESMARISSQADDEQRRAIADHLIGNGGSPDELRAAVEQFWSDAEFG